MKEISPEINAPGSQAAGSLAKKLLLSLASLLIFSTTVELLFRIFWVPGTLLFNLVPSYARDGYYYIDSDRRPVAIPRNKARQSGLKCVPPHYCIVVLGESAAFGVPYGAELSFSHFLHVMLKQQWPQVNWSVVNLSYPCQIHSFALVAARDAEAIRPDCLIIYSGNNELYAPNLFYAKQRMSGIGRHLEAPASFFGRHSSFYSALSSFVYGFRKTPEEALAHFNREAHIDVGIENYQWISEKIIDVAHRSRSRVLFCTPLINLRDFPPLPAEGDSTPLTGTQAVKQDGRKVRTASESFRLAQYYENLDDWDKAKALYSEASDKTAAFGRVHSRILTYIRNIPSRHRDVTVIDLERRLNISLPGDEELVDWCHPKIEMNYRIAFELLSALSNELNSRFDLPRSSLPSYPVALGRMTCNAETKEMLLAYGNCEAGYLNTYSCRWRPAKYYYEHSFGNRDYPFTLKAHLGLALSCLHLQDRKSAEEIARRVEARASKAAIKECIMVYFNRTRGSAQPLLELFQLETEG
jgi:hypothetical protein